MADAANAVNAAKKYDGAAGWDAAQARMAKRQRGRTLRLRVHEDCVLEGDEHLGFSALTAAACSRCQEPIHGVAVMVQVFLPVVRGKKKIDVVGSEETGSEAAE